MLHRVNYSSAAFGDKSVAFGEPDQGVKKVLPALALAFQRRERVVALLDISEVVLAGGGKSFEIRFDTETIEFLGGIWLLVNGAASGPQQPPAQKALHVATTVCNELHDDAPLLDSIDHSIRLEENFAKFGDAEVGEFPWMPPPLRKLSKARQCLLDAAKNISSALLSIVFGDVAENVIQIAQGIVSEDNAERHQPTYFFRRKAIASLAV